MNEDYRLELLETALFLHDIQRVATLAHAHSVGEEEFLVLCKRAYRDVPKVIRGLEAHVEKVTDEEEAGDVHKG